MCVCVSLSVCPTLCDPWTAARHAPLSMEFSVGSHALLQEIFPTWGWNPGFWHFRQILYHLNHLGLLTRAAGS